MLPYCHVKLARLEIRLSDPICDPKCQSPLVLCARVAILLEEFVCSCIQLENRDITSNSSTQRRCSEELTSKMIVK